jgi:hypothetical protein
MCEGLLDLKDAIDLISGLPGGPPRLSALDWWVIEVGREILNPFMLARRSAMWVYVGADHSIRCRPPYGRVATHT